SFEPVSAPADIDIESFNFSPAHNGRIIRSHVTQPSPLAEQTHFGQGRHQAQHIGGKPFVELQAAAHRIRSKWVPTGAKYPPSTSPPPSVWLTYTCHVPDTTTERKNGLTGSVTAACRGEVVTGSCTPAISEMREDQPAVQFIAVSVAILPVEVRTPVSLPPSMSMPVTSVCWMM